MGRGSNPLPDAMNDKFRLPPSKLRTKTITMKFLYHSGLRSIFVMDHKTSHGDTIAQRVILNHQGSIVRDMSHKRKPYMTAKMVRIHSSVAMGALLAARAATT